LKTVTCLISSPEETSVLATSEKRKETEKKKEKKKEHDYTGNLQKKTKTETKNVCTGKSILEASEEDEDKTLKSLVF